MRENISKETFDYLNILESESISTLEFLQRIEENGIKNNKLKEEVGSFYEFH